MKEIKDISGNKEIDESKLKDTQEIKEFSDSEYKNIMKEQKQLMESVPLESLRMTNDELIKDASDKKQGLTEDEKKRVRETHPDWPDSIVDAIGSWKEYEIYDKAGLVYVKINGKDCLVRADIDPEQKDDFGRTNKERMENGLSPLDKNGNSIELHHIGQKADSPLAELTQEEHRGKANDSILHDKSKSTEIDRIAFNEERADHWETRAKELTGVNV